MASNRPHTLADQARVDAETYRMKYADTMRQLQVVRDEYTRLNIDHVWGEIHDRLPSNATLADCLAAVTAHLDNYLNSLEECSCPDGLPDGREGAKCPACKRSAKQYPF